MRLKLCARLPAKPRAVVIHATSVWISVCVIAICAGCQNSTERLTFPAAPIQHSTDGDWYDVNHDGKPDFGLLRDSTGKVNLLEYDDDEDGKPDRIYRLSDYANDAVPHLILMLDSVPFNEVAKRYDAGEFGWFDRPQKVISVFPSLTEQAFTRMLDAPPLPGMIDDSYDTRAGRSHMGIGERISGYHQPWEYRCNYSADYWRGAASYLDPRGLFYQEMALARKAVDESPDKVTVCYITSASSMICKYGKPGCDEVLDEMRRLCLQLLYERCGAIKISVCADHGHNFMRSTNVLFDDELKHAGFRITNTIHDDHDIVIDVDGLVTYLGLHTRKPVEVADAVLRRDEVELVTYLQQDRVIARDHDGLATIEYRGGRFRYVPQTSDVLKYNSLVDRFRADGKMDTDGFVADADWFAATVDADFPDAPRRLWDAFHGQCVCPPDVMLTLRDGFCSGHTTFQKFITMASSHGGVNQINSATFLMTMTGRATHALRGADIVPTVAPGYVLPIRVR
jgi:hypothetical protein